MTLCKQEIRASMTRFLLFFLIISISGFCAKAQDSKAREIVKLALKKHTLGKNLRQYKVRVEYGKPGKAPIHLIYSEQALHFLDSIRLSVPDSIREIIEQSMVKADLERSALMEEILGIHNVEDYVDLTSLKAARIDISPNKLKGRNDTIRSVHDFRGKDILADFRDNNPVVYLQFMAAHLMELEYKETEDVDSKDYDIVRIKEDQVLREAYFDKKSHLLKRVVHPQFSNDPLTGKEIIQHKIIICFNNYQNRSGFQLPDSLEIINSQLPYTSKKGLHWIRINKPLPANIFAAEPSGDKKIKFEIKEISKDLYVLEKSGGFKNERSLLRLDKNGKIELFSSTVTNNGLNAEELKTVKLKFSGYVIENIFNIGSISSIESLSDFYLNSTKINAPKETGLFSEEKLPADSEEVLKRNEVRKLGLLTTFDKEFKTESVEVIILNPVRNDDLESIYVNYYLPKERTIFLYGNPYSADSTAKNAKPGEKILYDQIKQKSLKVGRLVFSEAYLDNAPLFMTFQDFETRIKNTDFSIYDKEKGN